MYVCVFYGGRTAVDFVLGAVGIVRPRAVSGEAVHLDAKLSTLRPVAPSPSEEHQRRSILKDQRRWVSADVPHPLRPVYAVDLLRAGTSHHRRHLLGPRSIRGVRDEDRHGVRSDTTRRVPWHGLLVVRVAWRRRGVPLLVIAGAVVLWSRPVLAVGDFRRVVGAVALGVRVGVVPAASVEDQVLFAGRVPKRVRADAGGAEGVQRALALPRPEPGGRGRVDDLHVVLVCAAAATIGAAHRERTESRSQPG